MRLRPERRVRKRAEFLKTQSEGRRVATRHFVLVIGRAPSEDAPSRLGITASRRVGNAVRRNRLKRIVRAAFRETGAFLPNGFEVVVICRADDEMLTSARVVEEWTRERRRIERAVRELSGTK